MQFKTIIEIQKYADFGIRYTDCIMVFAEELNVESLKKEFCSIEGIEGTKGIPYNMLDLVTDEFVAFLNKKGFVKLKTKEVIFTD